MGFKVGKAVAHNQCRERFEKLLGPFALGIGVSYEGKRQGWPPGANPYWLGFIY